MKCDHCGAEFENEMSSYCPNCMTPRKKCPHCGYFISRNSTICEQCGFKEKKKKSKYYRHAVLLEYSILVITLLLIVLQFTSKTIARNIDIMQLVFALLLFIFLKVLDYKKYLSENEAIQETVITKKFILSFFNFKDIFAILISIIFLTIIMNFR